MRRVIILTVILASMLMSCNSNDDPNLDTPSLVLNAFQTKFPEATDVEWEKSKAGYEVVFEIENIDHTAIIESDGKLIKYKYEILSSELPEAVKNTIKTNYGISKIDDSEILKVDEITYYQIEIDGGLMDDKLIFNSNGVENLEIEYLD